MKRLLTSVAAMAFAATTATAEVLVDDAGREVNIPTKVIRVIGTHDAIISLPLFELGFNVVGAWMRDDPRTGEKVLLGLKEMFDTTPAEQGITNIGGYDGSDLEVIKQLQPDLIVTYEGGEEQAEMMEEIAPVFVQRSFTGDTFGLSGLKVMAERFGAMEKYNELNDAYLARVEEVRAGLPFDPAEKTYAAIIIFDQMTVANGLSGAIQAVTDLGFQQPQWVKDFEQTGFTVPLSAEKIDMVQEDFVILMPGYSDPDQSEEATRAKMDSIAPGWDRFLKPEQGIMFANSVKGITPTFAAANYTLDLIEAHFAQ